MSLRKSPTRTADFLAAHRSNARKSTGPKTERGKSIVRLNALRHGRRSRPLGHLLAQMGCRLGVNRALYNWTLNATRSISDPKTPSYEVSLLQTCIRVLCQESLTLHNPWIYL